jgi:hypothetical protein
MPYASATEGTNVLRSGVRNAVAWRSDWRSGIVGVACLCVCILWPMGEVNVGRSNARGNGGPYVVLLSDGCKYRFGDAVFPLAPVVLRRSGSSVAV